MNKINILYKEMTKKRKNCNNIQENKKEPGELSLVARTHKKMCGLKYLLNIQPDSRTNKNAKIIVVKNNKKKSLIQ